MPVVRFLENSSGWLPADLGGWGVEFIVFVGAGPWERDNSPSALRKYVRLYRDYAQSTGPGQARPTGQRKFATCRDELSSNLAQRGTCHLGRFTNCDTVLTQLTTKAAGPDLVMLLESHSVILFKPCENPTTFSFAVGLSASIRAGKRCLPARAQVTICFLLQYR